MYVLVIESLVSLQNRSLIMRIKKIAAAHLITGIKAIAVLLLLLATIHATQAEVSAKYKSIVTDTTWITSDAQSVGKMTKMRCAQQCTAMGNGCFAFHLSSDNNCFLIDKNINLFEQRPLQRVTFWVKEGGNNTPCIAGNYPVAFGKSRYRVERNNKVNRAKAAGFCKRLGGKLIQLSSDAEREQVGNMAAAAGGSPTNVFNGMYLEGGVWKWHVTGENLNLTNYWDTADSQPDGGEYCGGYCIFDSCSPLLLHDIPCSWQRGYVCECSALV